MKILSVGRTVARKAFNALTTLHVCCALIGGLLVPSFGASNAALASSLCYLFFDYLLFGRKVYQVNLHSSRKVDFDGVSSVTLCQSAGKKEPVTPVCVLGAVAESEKQCIRKDVMVEKGLKLHVDQNVCYPNASNPTPFHNDFCSGNMIFLCKTDPPNELNDSHFAGRTIMFELQIQGRFTSIPQGTLYMGAELSEKPKWGIMTQTLSSVVMRFASQLVKVLHYSFGQKILPEDQGEIELMHATFPMLRVMDRVVITPDDGEDDPPVLGAVLDEDEEDRMARKSGKITESSLRTDAIYTMAFHSGLVDFQKWAVINVPGQGSIQLSTFFGPQALNIVLYDLVAQAGITAHRQCDKRYFFQASISNDSPGLVASPPFPPTVELQTLESLVPYNTSSWCASYECPDTTFRDTVDDNDLLQGADVDKKAIEMIHQFASAHTLEFKEEYEHLSGTNGYSDSHFLSVLSGAVVLLQVELKSDTSSEGSVDRASKDLVHYIDEARSGSTVSAAVIRTAERAPPAFTWLIKMGGGYLTYRSDRIYEGDVVMVFHQESNKYLAVGTGGMLKWNPARPSATCGYFTIGETEGCNIAKPRPLNLGCPFRLCSRKYPDRKLARMMPRVAGTRRHMASRSKDYTVETSIGFVDLGKRGGVGSIQLIATPWRDPFAMDNKEVTSPIGMFRTSPSLFSGMSTSIRGSVFFKESLKSDIESENEDVEGEGEDDGEKGVSDEETPLNSNLEQESTLNIRRKFLKNNYDEETNSDTDSGSNMRELGACPVPGKEEEYSAVLARNLYVEVVGFVDMLHRGRGSGQLAFALRCTSDPPSKRYDTSRSTRSWLILRTIQDLAFLSDVPILSSSSTSTKSDITTEISVLKSKIGGRLSSLPVPTDLEPFERSLRNVAQRLRDLQTDSSDKVLKMRMVLASMAMEQKPFFDRCLLRAKTAADLCVTPEVRAGPIRTSKVGRRDNGQRLSSRYAIQNQENLTAAADYSSECLDMPSVLKGVALVRLLWGERWREEWGAVGVDGLGVPAIRSWVPLSRGGPVWTLDISSIITIEPLSEERCPLAGLFGLRIEECFKVHYVAFKDRNSRDIWLMELQVSIMEEKGYMAGEPGGSKRSLSATSPQESSAFSSPAQSWPGSNRLILNARRAAFEFDQFNARKSDNESGKICEMSANLLRKVFSLDLNYVTQSTLAFFDDVSMLQNIDLRLLDRSSSEATCFWLNIYHTLNRHAFLVLGLPSAVRDWTMIQMSASYLIGGEVFSLIEIDECVLRDRLSVLESRQSPKYWPTLPPKNDHRRNYACLTADDRIHLALNNGTMSCVVRVYLMTPESLEHQMHVASQDLIQEKLKVDVRKRIMHVPGVLRGRREDKAIQHFCIKFASEKIIDSFMLFSEPLTCRYIAESMRCHPCSKISLIEPAQVTAQSENCRSSLLSSVSSHRDSYTIDLNDVIQAGQLNPLSDISIQDENLEFGIETNGGSRILSHRRMTAKVWMDQKRQAPKLEPKSKSEGDYGSGTEDLSDRIPRSSSM